VSTVTGETPGRPNGSTESAESSVDTLCPLSGNSVLARYGDLTLLCEAVPGQQHRVGALLDAVAGLAESDAGGRQLSRQVAALVGVAGLDDDFPALCAFGPADEGMVAVVHGGAELIITVNGEQMHLDGRDAATVLDRVITDPVESIQAVVGDTQVGAESTQALLPSPVPPPDGLPSPALSSLGPSSTGLDTPAPSALTRPPVPHVLGVHCKRDHFNDPESVYCGVCGISMAQGNHVQEWGPRPELGVLVLDDGTTHPLVCDTVIGRAPHIDEAVAAGEAEPLTLAHPMVSRRHLRIMLSDWQVTAIDAGSANGTFLMPRNATTWTRLEPGTETAIPPGSTISLGVVQLRYHSYRSH
jgi:hypothetical protein